MRYSWTVCFLNSLPLSSVCCTAPTSASTRKQVTVYLKSTIKSYLRKLPSSSPSSFRWLTLEVKPPNFMDKMFILSKCSVTASKNTASQSSFEKFIKGREGVWEERWIWKRLRSSVFLLTSCESLYVCDLPVALITEPITGGWSQAEEWIMHTVPVICLIQYIMHLSIPTDVRHILKDDTFIHGRRACFSFFYWSCFPFETFF